MHESFLTAPGPSPFDHSRPAFFLLRPSQLLFGGCLGFGLRRGFAPRPRVQILVDRELLLPQQLIAKVECDFVLAGGLADRVGYQRDASEIGVALVLLDHSLGST